MVTARIPVRQQRDVLPIAARRFLIAGQRSAWYFLSGLHNETVARAYWDDHSDWVVQWHVKRWPGTRPQLWWKWDSPGVRLRVGGIGSPLFECGGAIAELYEYGLPSSGWLTRDELTPFPRGIPVDLADLPRYESQASFLRRHGLLSREERSRLRPRDFWAEVIDEASL